MYDRHIVNGEKFDGKSMLDVCAIVIDAFAGVKATKGALGEGRLLDQTLRESTVAKNNGPLKISMQFFAEKDAKGGNEGTNKYQKASLWERLTKGKAYAYELNANPLDDFSNPRIGPCESAVTKYIKEISTKGKLSNPIDVQRLSTGGYEIVNGHHRWLAAKNTGLDRVPIRLKNYNN